MAEDISIQKILSFDPEEVAEEALRIRNIVLENCPSILEQIDLPAKMIAYTYGLKYKDMICAIIPSKTGVKLGFYKGNELPERTNK